MRQYPLVLAVLLVAACGGERSESDAGATGDTARAEPAAPVARVIQTIDSLEGPESVRWDPDQGVWFVSMVNGGPGAKDNNGYIARLGSGGAVDSLKFIAAGRNKVQLHAPKGLAIQGDTLWVADIDVVRGFNRKTGDPVASIRVPGATFLNDIAIGPDGLYVTDSGVKFGADGQMTHPGPDAVYKIAGRTVTTAVKFDGEPAPNGITWDSAGARFIVVPFTDNAITAWTPGDSVPQKIAEGRGMQDGVEPFGAGRFLFTSWADSSLSLLTEGRVSKLAGNLAGAADIGIDRESGRVAVPQLTEGKVTILQVDPGTP